MFAFNKKFVCVLDFEATCCNENTIPRNKMEIIEFPSVMLEKRGNRYVKVDEIQIYVKPVIYPVLTEFCTNLTGITQNDVNKGLIFQQAFNQHYNWLRKYDTKDMIKL